MEASQLVNPHYWMDSPNKWQRSDVLQPIDRCSGGLRSHPKARGRVRPAEVDAVSTDLSAECGRVEVDAGRLDGRG